MGTGGKVITVTFTVKAAGAALLNFSSGSVLANDGKGTNILVSPGSAQFSFDRPAPIIPRPAIPSAISGAPLAPQITSPTHPDPNQSYAQKDATFRWVIPPDTTAMRLLVSKLPHEIPTVLYIPAINEKQITDIPDGIWYIHARFRNANGWGQISHFKFQIDTQKPSPFIITEIPVTDPPVIAEHPNRSANEESLTLQRMTNYQNALVILIAILLFLIWHAAHKFSLLRKKVKKDVYEDEITLRHAFDLLKEEMGRQIKVLERAKTKRELTREEKRIIKQLSQHLTTAEKLAEKRLKILRKR